MVGFMDVYVELVEFRQSTWQPTLYKVGPRHEIFMAI